MKKLGLLFFSGVLLAASNAFAASGPKLSFLAIYNVLESEFGGIKSPAALDFLRALNSLSDYKYADGFFISDCVNAYKAAMPAGVKYSYSFVNKIIEEHNNLLDTKEGPLYRYIASGVQPDKNNIIARTADNNYFVAKILVPSALKSYASSSVFNTMAVFDARSGKFICAIADSERSDYSCRASYNDSKRFRLESNKLIFEPVPVGLLNADGLLRAIIFTSANFIPYGDEVLKLRLLLKNFDESAY